MKLHLFKSKNDYYHNFDKNTNIIIVTGMPGSGKSYTSRELSKKYNYECINFDYLFDYEIKEPSEFEKSLTGGFFALYPEYSNGEKNRSNTTIICNKFYDYTLNYIKSNNINIVFDGAYFLDRIPFEKYSNYRIVVKRVSFLLSIYRETKRDILRQYKNDITLLKKLVRIVKIFIVSIIETPTIKYQNYKNVNNLLSKLN